MRTSTPIARRSARSGAPASAAGTEARHSAWRSGGGGCAAATDYRGRITEHCWQGGACAICKQSPGAPLVVDRARVDGKVRGLLCRRCKFAITCFHEDPDLLRQASAYQKTTDDEP
jgi:hypothetical protein